MRLPQQIRGVSTPAPDEPIEVNQFRMDVPDNGYCWVEDGVSDPRSKNKRPGPEPYMVVKARLEKPRARFRANGYFPLVAEPFLFCKFRDLSLDCDSILEFANRYGWIEETSRPIRARRLWDDRVRLQTWRYEIQSMILADHLWACIQEDDRRTLRKYFRWDPKEFAVAMEVAMDERKVCAVDMSKPSVTPSWRWQLIGQNGAEELRKVGWNRGDVIGPARVAIMKLVNPRLSDHCHPHLFLNARGNFVGHLTPHNLLGCIWLQFYMMVIGQLKLRLCTVCKRELDVSTSRKTHKMHEACSKRRRQQRWRAKQRLDQPQK